MSGIKQGVDGWSNTPVHRIEVGRLTLEVAELPSKLARQGLGRYITMVGNRANVTTQGGIAKMLLASMHSESADWFAAVFETQTRVIKPLVTDRMTGEVALKFSVDDVWPSTSTMNHQVEWLLACLHLSFTDFLVEMFGGKKEATAAMGAKDQKIP